MTQYKLKPKTIHVEAIRFEYSEVGLIKLREFCGDRLLQYRKNRNPGAVGIAEISYSPDNPNNYVTAHEGDFIIRKPCGWLEVMGDVEFIAMYELA